MSLTMAAIKSGTDPVAWLPEGAFHRWMETPLGCPKCDVRYNLVVDYAQATGRFFEEESRGHIRMLEKAIFMGHGAGHRITHFETSGVVVKRFTSGDELPPRSRAVQ